MVHKIPATKELFQALYSHFLRLADADICSAPELREEGASAGARLEDNAVADRILCVRAMAALYAVHAGRIGEGSLFVCCRESCRACSSHSIHRGLCARQATSDELMLPGA